MSASPAVLKRLIDRGAAVSARGSKDGGTPLHHAAGWIETPAVVARRATAAGDFCEFSALGGCIAGAE